MVSSRCKLCYVLKPEVSMIDLHTHSLLSDGCLLPSELARRCQVSGVRALAITDHVDYSNIDQVVAGLVKASEELNKYWDIFVIPGVEVTHVPLESFQDIVTRARSLGAKIVVAHGESPVEPVLPGTNLAAIRAGVDILAHPGYITEEDAKLAADEKVYLEISCRTGHDNTNKHVFDVASKVGASMVLDTDAHAPADILTEDKRKQVLDSITDDISQQEAILRNSETIVLGLR